MTSNQHSYVYSHLKAILQRDFITLLPKKGLDHVAEKILGYLDAKSLCAAELVCVSWSVSVFNVFFVGYLLIMLVLPQAVQLNIHFFLKKISCVAPP